MVIRVTAWKDEVNLGSTLAEGATTSIAEENAIKQILKRISLGDGLITHYLDQSQVKIEKPAIQSNLNKNTQAQKIKKITSSSNPNKVSSSNEQNTYPEDWSKELASIDLQIKKLSWSRDEENKFLKNEFGLSDRNRITSYEILHSYLKRLEELNVVNASPDSINNSELNELLTESNIILRELQWDTTTARDFLSETMHVTSRQKLDVNGLKRFNILLKSRLSNKFNKAN